jgi:hypothetical protein
MQQNKILDLGSSGLDAGQDYFSAMDSIRSDMGPCSNRFVRLERKGAMRRGQTE